MKRRKVSLHLDNSHNHKPQCFLAFPADSRLCALLDLITLAATRTFKSGIIPHPVVVDVRRITATSRALGAAILRG